MRCQKIYAEASGATARSGVVLSGIVCAPLSEPALRSADAAPTPLVRERTTFLNDPQVRDVRDDLRVYWKALQQTDGFVQHLAMKFSNADEETYRELPFFHITNDHLFSSSVSGKNSSCHEGCFNNTSCQCRSIKLPCAMDR